MRESCTARNGGGPASTTRYSNSGAFALALGSSSLRKQAPEPTLVCVPRLSSSQKARAVEFVVEMQVACDHLDRLALLEVLEAIDRQIKQVRQPHPLTKFEAQVPQRLAVLKAQGVSVPDIVQRVGLHPNLIPSIEAKVERLRNSAALLGKDPHVHGENVLDQLDQTEDAMFNGRDPGGDLGALMSEYEPPAP